jgi:hypothetical protein
VISLLIFVFPVSYLLPERGAQLVIGSIDLKGSNACALWPKSFFKFFNRKSIFAASKDGNSESLRREFPLHSHFIKGRYKWGDVPFYPSLDAPSCSDNFAQKRVQLRSMSWQRRRFLCEHLCTERECYCKPLSGPFLKNPSFQ